MGTSIRAEVSMKNKYYIDKHRYYELKHFCLQYPQWKKAYHDYSDLSIPSSMIEKFPSGNGPSDPTARRAMMRAYYEEKVKLIEDIARKSDKYLHEYILKGVTENKSYTYLRSKLEIPCGRDLYYDRYRRFFWLLSEVRD